MKTSREQKRMVQNVSNANLTQQYKHAYPAQMKTNTGLKSTQLSHMARKSDLK